MQLGAYLHDKGPKWKALGGLFGFPSSPRFIKDLVMSGSAAKPQLSVFCSSSNLRSRYVESDAFKLFFFLNESQMPGTGLRGIGAAKIDDLKELLISGFLISRIQNGCCNFGRGETACLTGLAC